MNKGRFRIIDKYTKKMVYLLVRSKRGGINWYGSGNSRNWDWNL
jgi:hypothetical protein